MSVKITELPILDSLADNDIVAGVDVSGNVTSKIEMSTLKNYIDTNTQYTAGTNIDITNNVISAPNVPTKEEFDSLSTIFNAFPTESDEDESMTLDGTAEVKFKKFDLKGNTSQVTYTGKNLLINEATNQTKDGVTLTKNNDGSVTLNGTATAFTYFDLFAHNDQLLATENTTYTFYTGTKTKNGIYAYIFERINNSWSQSLDAQKIGTFTPNSSATGQIFRITIVSGTSFSNDVFYPMLVKGNYTTSTIGDYEPYVGGTASPNPSYPQDVHVVSGDNEIVVCGKNLANISVINQVPSTSNGNLVSYNGAGCTELIEIDNTKTYVFSYSQTSSTQKYIFYYDSNKNYLGNAMGMATNWVLSNNTYFYNAKYIRIRFDSLSTLNWCQLEKGSSASTYEPYISNTYNIDLPVENLLNVGQPSQERGGITFTKNADGTFTCSGTASSGAYCNLYVDESTSLVNGTTQSYTFSSGVDNSNIGLAIYEYVNGGWVEKKNEYSSSVVYTPTGTQAGQLFRFTVKSGANFTTPITVKPMVEKGTKKNTYTPYGTTPIELCKIGGYKDYIYKDSGKWYKYEAIGKSVLDENSNISAHLYGTNSFQTLLSNVISKDDSVVVKSNYFNGKSYNDRTQGDNIIYNVPNDPGFDLVIRNTSFTSLADFKTWLSTHNTEVYYVLATPTNTEITYQPLIDQLNALELAQSKENQTNISQVNNDLPFIISAEAILSLKNVLDRIELLES